MSHTPFNKALSAGAAALMLGGTLATAPTIAASPDSSFGFVQSAHAAEVLPSSAFTVTTAPSPANSSLVNVNIAFDFTGRTVNEGDFFTINLDLGNAPAYSDANTYNGQQVIDGGTLFENTTAHSGNATWAGNYYTDLFAGKNIAIDLGSVSLGPGNLPATITDAQGNTMFNLVTEGKTAKYVATSYAASRANLTGSVQYPTNGILVSNRYGATTLLDGTLKVNDNTLTFTDGTRAGDYITADSPRSEYTDVWDTKVPASVYINGDIKTTFNGNLRTGFVMNKEIRNISSNPSARYFQDAMDSLNGYVSLYTVHATPETVGKRIQSVFTQSDATSPLADFTCDATSLQALTYTAQPHTESNGGPVAMTAAEAAVAYPGGLVGQVNGSYDPWQVQVESCTSEQIIISWVPKSAGDALAFVDKNIKVKYAAEVGNQQLTSGFMTLTSSIQWPDGTAVTPYTATRITELGERRNYTIGNPTSNTQSTARWSGGTTFSDAFPVAAPDTSTTTANTPVSSKLVTNDEFPESSYGSTVITGQPSNGTVTVAADGTATYTPNPGFVGTDVVTYKNTSAAGVESNETTWTIEVVAPAAPIAQPDVLSIGYNGAGKASLTNNDSANGVGNSIKTDTAAFTDGTKSQVIDGIKFTINSDGTVSVDAAGANHAGAYKLDYTVQDIYGTPAQASITVTVAEPSITVGLKVLINGQDANNPDEPLILAPGDYTATYQITNPNPYPLSAADLALTNAGAGVDVPADVVVAPGETVEVTGAVSVPKQGTVVVEGEVAASYTYTFNGQAKTITATAQDPAYMAALTGTIAANPDQVRVRVGETTIIKYLENDATDPEGHPLDPATAKFTAGEGWTTNEGGTFTREDGLTVKNLGNGGLEVTGGSTEGTFEGLSYTVENTLGDVSEQTAITIEVYDFHVDLEALIGEEKQDADGTEDAFKVTIGHDEETTIQPITLPVTNTGADPITVAGFQQVNTSDGGAGFEITLDEPVTLAPGESFTYTYELELPVGEHVIEYKVLTVEGAVDTDPVVVVVDQEEAPAPAPTPETPVVEQEKPKTPTPVVPETGIKGASVEAKTADELAGSDAAAQASAQAAPAGFSVGKVVAGVLGALAVIALAAWGVLALRGRGAKDA